jgi:hypothetical protein
MTTPSNGRLKELAEKWVPTLPHRCIAALAELRDEMEKNDTKRDGNWLDSFGCCKVCDGQIPYGHAENCDIWKIEQKLAAAEQRIGEQQILISAFEGENLGKQIAIEDRDARIVQLEAALKVARDALRLAVKRLWAHNDLDWIRNSMEAALAELSRLEQEGK